VTVTVSVIEYADDDDVSPEDYCDLAHRNAITENVVNEFWFDPF